MTRLLFMTRLVLVFLLSSLLLSCSNMKIEFDDFGLTTVCFPYQTPARTLILGRYDQGFNDNDNNHKFEIGVTLSGLYENKTDRKVWFEVDKSMLLGVTNVKALPESYYRIETESPVVIPKGSFKGRITVTLTDAFFEDSESIVSDLNKVNFVIPLKITDIEKIDSVLVGKAAVDNPNRLMAAHWEIVPKDYTLFGIKYVNPYDGYFLRRGVDKLFDMSGVSKGETVYHAKYVENDELVRTRTETYTQASVPGYMRRPDQTDVDKTVYMDFKKGDGTCIVLDEGGNTIGDGKYVPDGDAWGGKSRDVIYLHYKYDDTANSEKHEVLDTLVMRDRDIIFEQFTVSF